MSIHPFREHIPSGVDLLQNYNNYFKHENNILKKLFFLLFMNVFFQNLLLNRLQISLKCIICFYVSLKTFLLLISAFR